MTPPGDSGLSTDAAAAGLVDVAVAETEVLMTAVARVRPLAGKTPKTLGAIKAQMYAGPLQALRNG